MMTVNRSTIRALIVIFLLNINLSLFAAWEGDSPSNHAPNLPSSPQNQDDAKAKQPPPDKDKDKGWGFGTILFVLGCFGAFGGGLAAFSQVTFSEVMKDGIKAYGSGERLAGIVTVGALLGCGGAIAFGFILAVDRKFTSGGFDLDTKLLIAAASVAAGFSGIRLLKLVSDKLAKQVEEQGADINAQKKEIKQQQTVLQQQQAELQKQKSKLEQERQIAEALSFAGGIIGGSDDDRSLDGYRRDAVKLLEEARKFDPASRAIGVYLGRLYRQLKEYPKAIQGLEETLGKRRSEKIPIDKDDATLIYNKACYLNLDARTKTGEEKTKLKSEAQIFLKEAQTLDAELTTYAATDPDWKE